MIFCVRLGRQPLAAVVSDMRAIVAPAPYAPRDSDQFVTLRTARRRQASPHARAPDQCRLPS